MKEYKNKISELDAHKKEIIKMVNLDVHRRKSRKNSEPGLQLSDIGLENEA